MVYGNGFSTIRADLKPIIYCIGLSDDEASRRTKIFVDEIKNTFSEENIHEPLVVRDIETAHRIYDFVERNIDAIILNVSGPRALFRKLVRLNIPIILWEDKGYSHAASWDIRGYLSYWGGKVFTPIGNEEAKRIVKLLSGIEYLKRSKLIVFGSIPCQNLSSQWCLEYIERVLGVEVKTIPIDNLLKEIDKIDEKSVEEILDEWRAMFEEISENRVDALKDSIRMYIAMKKFLEKEGGNALTINCLADLFKYRFITPCIPLAKFIDEGIIAGCEADINVALSMMILSYISRQPSIMGNIYLFRPWPGPGFPPTDTRIKDIEESLRTNIVRLTHDVIPLTMSIKDKFILEDYHNTGRGVTAYAPLKVGEKVTLLRINPSLDEIFIIRGKIVRVEDTIHCRISVWIKVSDVKAIAENAYAFHHAMIYGDWSKELIKFAELMNIKYKLV